VKIWIIFCHYLASTNTPSTQTTTILSTSKEATTIRSTTIEKTTIQSSTPQGTTSAPNNGNFLVPIEVRNCQ
jgi:hypothetical protein